MRVFRGMPTKTLYDTGDKIRKVILDAERSFVSQEDDDRDCIDLVLRFAVSTARKPRRVTVFTVFCDRGVSEHDFSVISFGSLTTYRNLKHTGSREPRPQRKWFEFQAGDFRFDGRYLVVVSWQ